MTSSREPTTPGATDCGCVSVPVNPWLSNHYHFGMLLGVDDLETDQGYHRGKTWLHTAWLHGAGTVWGLSVGLDPDRREIVVDPGLAVTAAGRELYLSRRYCVDIARWLEEADPEAVEIEVEDGVRHFTVHVVAGPRHCLDRPVPAIAEPCAGSGSETSYSRSVEVVRLTVVPGEPEPAPDAFSRTRAFLGCGPADDDLAAEIASAYDAIGSRPADEQGAATVAWLRRFAADDAIARAPSPDGSPFPAGDDAPVLLATVRVALRGRDAGATMVVDGDRPTRVEQRDRPALVPTAVISDLLAAGVSPAGPVPVDEGPRADPESVSLTGAELRFEMDGPLDPQTLRLDAFAVTAKTTAGWEPVAVSSVTPVDGDTTVVLDLDTPVADRPLRVIALGTGPMPILGADGRPVAGVRGGPPAGPDDGHDIVLMVRS